MVKEITIKNDDFNLSDEVEIIFEKTVTAFGNSAKADIPKKYIGKRAYVIIIKD
jgi:putative transposon-encoded protein